MRLGGNAGQRKTLPLNGGFVCHVPDITRTLGNSRRSRAKKGRDRRHSGACAVGRARVRYRAVRASYSVLSHGSKDRRRAFQAPLAGTDRRDGAGRVARDVTGTEPHRSRRVSSADPSGVNRRADLHPAASSGCLGGWRLGHDREPVLRGGGAAASSRRASANQSADRNRLSDPVRRC